MCQRLIIFASVSASNGGFQRLIGYELAFSYLIQNPGTWEFKGLNAQN